MRMDIDWSRMARPQADEYDTHVILELVSLPSERRPQPFLRLPVEDAPTLFEGRVAVRKRSDDALNKPGYVHAPPDHPNLKTAAQMLSAWPEIAAQFPALVHTIQPWVNVEKPAEYWEKAPGSASFHREDEFGIIMVTVESAMGLAQAMVHEMSHHKLYAIGVPSTGRAKIITNCPDDLYRSSIVTARKCPMTAVFHVQYSFIHVTALDVALYDQKNASEQQKRLALKLLKRNVPRMEEGYSELLRHARTDYDGQFLMEAFMDWSEEVIGRGNQIPQKNAIFVRECRRRKWRGRRVAQSSATGHVPDNRSGG